MERILQAIEKLYENNGKELYKLCHKEMAKFGGISQMEYDNFYSRVGLELAVIKHKYENTEFNLPDGKTVMDFLCGAIKRSIWKEMTDKNRLKRQLIIEREETDANGNPKKVKEYIPNISIDAPISDDDNSTIGDIIADKSTIEKEIFEEKEECYSEKMLLYLSRLSAIQKEMLRLTIAGYLPNEIREELHMTEKQYCDNYAAIHSYRNVSILF